MLRTVGVRTMIGAAMLIGLVWNADAQASNATFFDGEANATNALDAAILAPPTSPSAVNISGTRARVDWTATTSTFADGYRIYRSTTSGCCYAHVGTETPRTDTNFTDTGVSRFTTYYYVVESYRVNWSSVFSVETAITID